MQTATATAALSGPEYRTLVEQSPILIWRAGTDMLCNYFNERWLAFTGRRMEQEIGNRWAEGVHPDDFDRCLEVYTTHFERRGIFEMEYRLRRHDGEYRWLLDRGVPFYVDGTFAGYIGSCVDVHARVEAEAALEAHRQAQVAQLRHLLPMCAWCGRVRNDQGYWEGVTKYLEDQGLGRTTHGICVDCEEKLSADSA